MITTNKNELKILVLLNSHVDDWFKFEDYFPTKGTNISN